jgi:hypothetical protein
MDRLNAEWTCRGNVRLDIVDVDGTVRIDGEARDQQFENARVRLDQSDLARDENPVKALVLADAGLESFRTGRAVRV